MQKINRRTFLRVGAGAAAVAAYLPALIAAEIQDIEFSFIQVMDTHFSKRPVCRQ